VGTIGGEFPTDLTTLTIPPATSPSPPPNDEADIAGETPSLPATEEADEEKEEPSLKATPTPAFKSTSRRSFMISRVSKSNVLNGVSEIFGSFKTSKESAGFSKEGRERPLFVWLLFLAAAVSSASVVVSGGFILEFNPAENVNTGNAVGVRVFK
jgi:hypothetical protein